MTAAGPGFGPARAEQPWVRLDARMLAIHPVREAIRLLPVLLVAIFAGSASGNHLSGIIVAVVLVFVAIGRWLSTTYRIGDELIEMRAGILRRTLTSIPRSRVRSVDVEATVMHRVLGLSIVRIGTGQKASKDGPGHIELNGIATRNINALRAELLSRAALTEPSPGPMPMRAPGLVTPAHAAAQVAVRPEMSGFRWSWARFAPLSTTGLAIFAGAAGLASQAGIWDDLEKSGAESVVNGAAERLGVAASIAVAVVIVILAASLVAVIRYVVTYGNFRLTDDGQSLHVGHGLLRTRAVSLDRGRLRGVTMRASLLLRLARGARLEAIMTGVSAEGNESSLLLPAAPGADVVRVGSTVLRRGPAALTGALISHGPVALRRRITRAMIPVILLAVTTAVWAAVADVPWWIAVVLAALAAAAIALAVDRYRGLGHGVEPGTLVVSAGSLERHRDVVDAAGIVGWNVRQSFFQRRAGVATVIATTGAGRGHYDIVDVPIADAWSIVEAARPGSGDVWARRG